MRPQQTNIILAITVISVVILITILNRGWVKSVVYKNLGPSSTAMISDLSRGNAKDPLSASRVKVARDIVVNKLLGTNGTFIDMYRFLRQLDDDCSSMLIPETEALRNEPYLTKRLEQ